MTRQLVSGAADELRMSIQTLRRISLGWLLLSVWLVGTGCDPASPLPGAGTDEPSGAGAGPGDAAVDRILVTAGTGGCSGSASCAGGGVPPDAGPSGAGASDGRAPADGGAADPRAPDATWAGDTSVGSGGTGGHAGAGGAAALPPTATGGTAGAAPSPPAGPAGGAAGIAGRGGSAGQTASGTPTGGSSGTKGDGGGGGGVAGSGGGAGRAGSSGVGGSGPGGGAGSPGTSAPAPAAGELRIVELMVNPTGTDTGREWIEVANTAGHPLDLAGVHVADAANDAALDFGALGGAAPILPAGGRAVLIQSADASKNGGIALGAGNSGILGGAFGTHVSLNNDVDTITLCAGPCRAGGVTLDENTWTDLGTAYDGHALSIDEAGRRCAATAPYGDAGSFGTPGAANPTCP